MCAINNQPNALCDSNEPFLRPIDFSIKLYTMESGWYVIDGLLVYINFPKYIAFLSMKIDFVLANNATFHLDLHCLPKYTFRDIRSIKDKRYVDQNWRKVTRDL